MYKAFDSRWENESKDDEGSLSSSSFWTDQESEGEERECVKKENRVNAREPEEDHKDVKECFLMGGDKKKRVKELLQENELEKEKYPEEGESEVERECFIDYENKNSIEITRTRKDKEEEESEEEVEEESEEEEEGSRDEKEELCEQQTGNEKEEEDDAKESEEGEKGKELEEEEFELCEQGEGNKKEEEESEESEEEEHMSEDEKDSEEEKESSASAENTEENEETKAQSDDSEGEKDQESLEESEEEESFSKEDSESEEKCTGELSECEEKKESLTKEESTSGSGEENSHFSEEGEENEGANVCCVPEDSEGTEGKIDGGKYLVKEERTRNSESEGSENSKQREPNSEEEEQKDSTEENPDSDEERNCVNKYDEEIGKSRPGADECDNWVEELRQHNSDEVSKGGSEEEEARDWFFNEPVEEKEACDQDRKSWASDDDYVTIASGHSQKDEEENYNMIPVWEQERDDVQQTKETRDVYVEDFHESLGSPAASVLTSGYGTYRPDSPKDGDPEEVDYRDDCTLAGLEEESELILDARDYEDDSSPAWLRDNQALETSDGQALAESPDASRDVTVCTDQCHNGSEDDSHRSPDFPNREHQTDLRRSPTENDTETQHGGSENVAYFTDGWEVEDLRDSLDHPFNLRHRRGIVQKRPEEKQYNDGYDDSKKRRKEKRVRAYTGCLGVLHWLKGFTYFVVFRGMALEGTEERRVFSFYTNIYTLLLKSLELVK